MIAYRIKVMGKVQGVFFRASTKEKADELGIKGWVKNLPEGSVLIEAEGDQETMNQFLSWCNKGPILARVDNINVTEIESGDYGNFKITH